MKHILFPLLSLFAIASFSQKVKNNNITIETWKNAVINIEMEGYVYSKYVIDSTLKSKKDSGYNQAQLDSVYKVYSTTQATTATAIYVIDKSKKYIITAKHVLFDSTLVKQKIYENKKGINKWNDPIEAIYTRISIRTPITYFKKEKKFNNFGVTNNSFVTGIKPYIFESDLTGDGVGIISLQEKNYKFLDTLLQTDGYIPISIDKLAFNEDYKIDAGDEVFTIGFPEKVSVYGRANPAPNTQILQTPDLVMPFISFGKVAMIDSALHFFYADLTTTPGNSGGPVIFKNKIIGIVSGINKYSVITDDKLTPFDNHLYGIGHLVSIIKTSGLRDYLITLQKAESDFNK